MYRHIELTRQLFEAKTVQKDRLIVLQRHLRNDRKVSAHMFACREKITTREQARNTDVTAKVIVDDGRNDKLRTSAMVVSVDHFAQHRREQRSRQDRAAYFIWYVS